MSLIGFSLQSFFLWPNQRLNFLLEKLKKIVPRVQAIELSDFWSLKEILDNACLLKKYKFCSFHLPTKGYKKWIRDLNKYQNQLRLNHLVIHPNEVKDWSILKGSKIPLLIENNDKYKKTFRTAEEMEKLLKKFSGLKMCLDVCHLEDQFPGQTPKWLNQFKNHLAEIHLSGINRKLYRKWTKEPIRHSLCLFDKNILDGLRGDKIKKCPIILEGVIPPNRWDLVKKEFEVANNSLK